MVNSEEVLSVKEGDSLHTQTREEKASMAKRETFLNTAEREITSALVRMPLEMSFGAG